MRARDYGSSLADKTERRANEANGSASMTIGNDTAEKADVWRRLSFYFTSIYYGNAAESVFVTYSNTVQLFIKFFNLSVTFCEVQVRYIE